MRRGTMKGVKTAVNDGGTERPSRAVKEREIKRREYGGTERTPRLEPTYQTEGQPLTFSLRQPTSLNRSDLQGPVLIRKTTFNWRSSKFCREFRTLFIQTGIL